MRHRRFLSLFLAFVLCLSLMPSEAFAATDEVNAGQNPIGITDGTEDSSDNEEESPEIEEIDSSMMTMDESENTVRVSFIPNAEGTEIAVYKDGVRVAPDNSDQYTYELIPGEYSYNTACDGYITVYNNSLVVEDIEEQTVTVTSDKIPDDILVEKDIYGNEHSSTIESDSNESSSADEEVSNIYMQDLYKASYCTSVEEYAEATKAKAFSLQYGYYCDTITNSTTDLNSKVVGSKGASFSESYRMEGEWTNTIQSNFMSGLIDQYSQHTGNSYEGDYFNKALLSAWGISASGISYDAQTGYSTINDISITLYYHTSEEQQTAVEKAVDEIAEELDLESNQLSDYDKLYAIDTWLMKNVRYAYTDVKNTSHTSKYYNAYGILVDKCGVCAGFASAFYALALKAGIDSRIITSSSMGHAWNILKLADKYYYADATWDSNCYDKHTDSTDDDGGEPKYFLKGKTEWLTSHDLGDQYNYTKATFNKTDYPVADNNYGESSDFTITYDANGGTGAPDSQTGNGSVTLSSGIPTKLGYNFLGWGLSSTSTGYSYLPGASYNLSKNVTLYAVWGNPTEIACNMSGTYQLAINSPNMTRFLKITPSENASLRFESSGTEDTYATLYAADGTKLAYNDNGGDDTNFRLDYDFTAGSTYYLEVKYNGSATGSIYAKVYLRYIIAYNANGGTNAPASQTKIGLQDLTLSTSVPKKSYTITYNANGGTCSTTSASKSCTFKNWNTSSAGTGTSYASGATFTLNNNYTLYAQWTNPTYGTLPTPTRSGYTFNGWYTAATGGTKIESTSTLTGNTTIYAHWTANSSGESGVCGDNASWTLNQDGTLTITGTGAVTSASWSDYKDSIINVCIKDGITSLCDEAFMEYSALTTVSFSSDLVSIGNQAFFDCNNLENVTFPDTLTSIGYGAFFSCDKFTEVVLPENLIYLNFDSSLKVDDNYVGVFSDCDSLEEVSISPNLKYGTCAFSFCDNLETVSFADGAATVFQHMFRYDTALNSVSLPDTITAIEGSAFARCNRIESISLPESVISIDNFAFYLCPALESINIPDSVTTIGNYAFYGCTAWGDTIQLPDTITSVGDYAFQNTPVRQIYVPNTEVTLGTSILASGSTIFGYIGSTAETYTDNNTDYIFVSLNPSAVTNLKATAVDLKTIKLTWDASKGAQYYRVYRTTGTSTVYTSNIRTSGTSYTDTDLTPGIRYKYLIIPQSQFLNTWYSGDQCSPVGCTLTIPSVQITLNTAGDKVTLSWSSIDDVDGYHIYRKKGSDEYALYTTVSNTVTTWSDSDFEADTEYSYKVTAYCDANESAYSNEVSATPLSSNASGICGDNSTWSLDKAGTLTITGQGAVSDASWGDYKDLIVNIVIGDSITSISNNAFNGCTALKSVSIPESVTFIGVCAFYGCTALKSVIIPDSITTIEIAAFCGCSSLTSVTLPDSVTSIAEGAFCRCTSLTSVTIPDSVTEIGSQAFNSTGLTSVSLSKNVSSIWTGDTYNSFGGSHDLKEIIVADGNTTYASYDGCLYNADLSELLYCPEGIEETNISDQTTTVNRYAFDSGTVTDYALNAMFFEGNAPALPEDVFNHLTTKAYYQKGNTSWTTDIRNDYGGTVTWKTWQPDVSKWTVTLSDTSFTYTGRAITPEVTVVSGADLTVTKNSDYTVTYSNNTNVGIGTIVITGEGKYSGKNIKTFTIKNVSTFTWGTDNWSFNNSSNYYFSAESSRYIDLINSTYLNKLKQNLTNTEYDDIFNTRYGMIYDQWGGSCQGMSTLVLLAKDGLVPYSNYKSGASSLNQLNSPISNSNINSLITYYHMLQEKEGMIQKYCTIRNRSNKTNINEILTLLESNPTVLIGFQTREFGHAIIAYGHDYGSYTFNGVSYQGVIYICDPNHSLSYDSSYNIYYNTTTYNWIIPAYSSAKSTSNAYFDYVGSSVDEINDGGYLSGTSSENAYTVAHLTAESVADSRSVSKVVKNNGSYHSASSSADDIVESYSFVRGSENNTGEVSYSLYDTDASYKLVQDSAVELQLDMNYENCSFKVESAAGTSALFDKSGYVEVNGESADYTLSMTSNEDYPMDWFTVNVDGTGANTASLTKTSEGYILESDNLTNVNVDANNKEETVSANFSTAEASVLICEENGNLAVKADYDHNGSYESLLNENVSIQKQPENCRVGLNHTCTFSLTANRAVSYQWQYSKDGVKWYNSSSASAKTDTLSFTVKTSNSTNIYRCKVTGEDGTVLYSDEVNIDLIPKVKISTQPVSAGAVIGNQVVFTIAAENVADTDGYQWYYSKDNGTTWFKSSSSGCNTDTFTVTVKSTNKSYLYRCKLAGMDGNTINSSTVGFVIITTQPKTSSVSVGSTASFTVTADDISAYQWYYSKDNGATWFKSSATGNATDTISFKATTANRSTIYRCKLTTTTGLSAWSGSAGFAEGLKITTQPVSVSTVIGSKAVFKVTAENTASTGAYQWYYSKDGKTWYKSSATGNATSTLTVSVTSANKANYYRCKVTGADGKVQYTDTVTAK